MKIDLFSLSLSKSLVPVLSVWNGLNIDTSCEFILLLNSIKCNHCVNCSVSYALICLLDRIRCCRTRHPNWIAVMGSRR